MTDARPVSTLQHGVVDYTWSALMPILPRLLGANAEATRIFDAVAATGAVQSVMTDYETGLVKVMPMQAHLAMDGMIGVGLIGAAALMTRQPPEVRLALLGAGLFAIATAAMTDPIPTGEGRKNAVKTANRDRTLAGDRAGAVAGRRERGPRREAGARRGNNGRR